MCTHARVVGCEWLDGQRSIIEIPSGHAAAAADLHTSKTLSWIRISKRTRWFFPFPSQLTTAKASRERNRITRSLSVRSRQKVGEENLLRISTLEISCDCDRNPRNFARIFFRFLDICCIALRGWFLVRKPIILREKVEWERFLCDEKEFVHNASFAYPLRSLRMKCWTWDLNFRQKTAFEPLCWCSPFKEGSIETAKDETIRPQKLSPFTLALA